MEKVAEVLRALNESKNSDISKAVQQSNLSSYKDTDFVNNLDFNGEAELRMKNNGTLDQIKKVKVGNSFDIDYLNKGSVNSKPSLKKGTIIAFTKKGKREGIASVLVKYEDGTFDVVGLSNLFVNGKNIFTGK